MRPRIPDRLDDLMEDEVEDGVPVFRAEGDPNKRAFVISAIQEKIKRVKKEYEQ